MYNQPRFEPLEPSSFFEDNKSARPLVPGTVHHEAVVGDSLFANGLIDGRLSNVAPFPVTQELIARGRERFNIYCAVCHGATGHGDGMIVRRGFPQPPSYHTDRLRQAPIGHFVHVITHGYGVMYSYANRVPPADRWAIAAYIRALQLSQHAPVELLSAAERDELQREGAQ